jgi:hypothetical protein
MGRMHACPLHPIGYQHQSAQTTCPLNVILGITDMNEEHLIAKPEG